MFRKLKSQKGETLVETIAAILVVSLASAAFAAMIMSASKLNSKAAEIDQTYYAALETVEKNDGATHGTVTVGTDTGVKIYWTERDKLRAYRSAGGGGTP